tara:strand:+ start:862 stop:2481 length:1620 start_codon:yes stop_codon:yes gene_type:complete
LNLVGLKWEAKGDGMYLTADDESNFTEIQDIEDELLRDLIMNMDMQRVGQILVDKSGQPEFAGPHFIRFDQGKLNHLEIICTQEYAKLTVRSSIKNTGLVLSVHDLEFILKVKKVIHGVDWSFVDKIISSQSWGPTHIIAKYTPAVRGDDAKILELVEIDPDAKPLANCDGSVDFKVFENIQQIKEGAIICKRIAPTPGESGKNIFGHEILATPGDDANLPRGKNTIISEDNLELRALNSGYLYREGLAISVGRLYVVQGNVSFKTGNIKYSGDVVIHGNVQANFEVIADGDITIEGEVEAARVISTNGFVHIKRGVFGKGKAFISGAKGVRVNMAQHSEIISEGIVEFDLHLFDTKVKAEALIASGSNSLINNCDIVVYDRVACHKIGTPAGATTKIEFLNRKEEEALVKFDNLNTLYIKLQVTLEGLENRLRSMKAMLKRATEITQRSKDQLKKVLIEYEGTKKKKTLVEKKRQSLTLAASDSTNLPAQVLIQELQPKLEVVMYGKTVEFFDGLKEIKIYWNLDAIQTIPLEKGELR